jgi:hypothetical protein
MSIKRLVGIDFGTSSTYIKVKHYENNTAKEDRFSAQYVDFNGNAWVPTLIQKLGDDYWFGYDAQTKKSNNAVIYRNFKMSLENKDDNIRNEARHLIELFFNYLFHMYQDQFSFDKYDEIETIVSYPAKWQDDTIAFLEYAAKKAGFQNVKSMDEPTAALNAVIIQNTSRIIKTVNIEEGKPFYILMIDMGAGTTDLAVLKCYMQNSSESSCSILSRIITTWPRGDEQFCFGGREVEEHLYKYLHKYLMSMPNVTEKMAENILKPQMDNIKSWKENTVSSSLNKNIEVSNCPFLSPVLPLITDEPAPLPSLGRIQFESELEEYLESFVALIDGCIEETNKITNEFFGMNNIDLVILTGGHSQWYFVRDILNGTIKEIGNKVMQPMMKYDDRIFSLARPQETVSLGLVYSPLRLKMDSQNEPLIEFDKTEERYCYVSLNKVIYKVDKYGQDVPIHLKWIELLQYERPDSMLSIVNNKFNLKLSRFSLNYECICKQFIFLSAGFEDKYYIIRVNLEEPFPNPVIIYESESYIVNIVSYGGVLYIVEKKDDIKSISQLSLDGTKKRFLFELNSIEANLAEKVYSNIIFADEKYIYGSSMYDNDGGSTSYILQMNYKQKSIIYKTLDEIAIQYYTFLRNVFIYGENIYYYNDKDGICVMNSETKQKRCLLRGKYQLWGVNDNSIIFSDVIMESNNGLYSMDLSSYNKKLIVSKMIESAIVAGEWILYLGKGSPNGKAGAFLEKFVVNISGSPYCVKTDGTRLNKL